MIIKNISSSGRHTIVNGGNPSPLYINSYSGQTMVGQIRWNPNNQNLEVYDGNSWMSMPSSYTSVGLPGTAENAIDWAIQTQQEELVLLALCEKHPGLKEAYEKFQVMKALVTVEDKKAEK